MAGKLSGSAIQSGTITVTQLSGSFNDTTNAAYAQANSAYGQANAARSDANTTFATVNSTFGTINTNYQAAYAAANNSNLKLGGVITGTLNVTQDIIVGGNVYLEGNTTYINVATYSIEDSLMYLASNNSLTDSVDIGFMGGKNTSGTYSHTGLARDATDGKYKLFDGLAEEGHVGNVVDFANTYLATLVANVEANTLTVVNGVSGNVNFDSGTLFVDSVGNAVGIGTTNPNAKLHIAGDGVFTGNVAIGSTSSGANLQIGSFASNTSLRFSTINNGAAEIQFYDNNDTEGSYIRNDGQQYGGKISFGARWDDNEDKIVFDMRQASAGAAFNARVGIGTASPAHILDIIGDSGSNTWARVLGGAGGTSGGIIVGNDDSGKDYGRLFWNNSGNLLILSHEYGGGALTIRTSSTERMRIASNGWIGFGTTSPTNQFHFSGGSNDGRVSITNNDRGNGNADGLWVGVDSTQSYILSRGNYPLTFYTNATSKMVITSAGNVGIGTNSPATTLHVDASSGGIVRVSRLGTGSGILQLEADGTDGTITTTNNMKFVTNGEEQMRLDTSGNLFLNAFSGRGGGSTGYLFKLNPGKVYFELMANNTTSSSDILFTDGASGAYGIVGYDHSNDSLRIYTNSSWQMTVDSSGNVGIGATSPYSKLHLNGALTMGVDAATARPALKSTYWGYSASYRALLIGSSNTSYTTSNTGAVTVCFNYDPSANPNGSFSGDGREIIFRRGTRFVTPNSSDNAYNLTNLVLLDGNVGIGTDSPSQSLSVQGNVSVSGVVTQSAVPAFFARSLSNPSTSGYVTTVPSEMVFATVTYNNGNHYSNSTGRFTAPVSGYYWMFVSFLVDDNVAAGEVSNVQAMVNGSVINGFVPYAYQLGTGTYYLSMAGGMVVQLNAGDYFSVRANQGKIHTGSETHFSGFLIG